MAGLIDLRENQVLDRLFGGAALSPPGTWYLGLFTSPPADDGTGGTEVSGGSYARVAVVNDLVQWPAASGGSKNNANDIVFPTASAGWGVVTHWGLFDAVSGGNLWAFAALDAPRTVLLGDDFRFIAGAITLSLD
ncbi:MAG: hypothetical protein AB7W59_00090 [Acidimicrobiia bacterium]